ncbi:MAG: response regulator [Acidobacteria bacterium]|nr:MAG: response regulator [Acidobacteriota bacterium]REK00209.1 MAG: response regulator [Acidobacteriota bacterium]
MAEKVLVVDDETAIRELLVSQVTYMGHHCVGAATGAEALAIASMEPHPALVLSDVEMPGIPGDELLERLLKIDPQIQVVMVTANSDLNNVRRCLRSGAYDYIIKPYDLQDLGETMERALERRRLRLQVDEYQNDLERRVREKTREVLETRDIALLAVAKLAECRDDSTGLHLDRMQWYSRVLAEELAVSGPYRAISTPEFVDHLFKSSPLHDIGKVAIPDQILLKEDTLTEEEWAIMKTHTTRGGDTLREVIESQVPFRSQGARFLRMAMEIAYDHHERWDGSGYPSGKKADDIPLGARVVAVADAYDAITASRPYKVAAPHDEAVERIRADAGSHFDPHLVEAFVRCAAKFSLIQKQMLRQGQSRPRLQSEVVGPTRSVI